MNIRSSQVEIFLSIDDISDVDELASLGFLREFTIFLSGLFWVEFFLRIRILFVLLPRISQTRNSILTISEPNAMLMATTPLGLILDILLRGSRVVPDGDAMWNRWHVQKSLMEENRAKLRRLSCEIPSLDGVALQDVEGEG